MKIGVAFSGNDNKNLIIPEILYQCKENHISPTCYVLSQNTLSGFLCGLLFKKSRSNQKLFSQLKQFHISHLHQLATPILVCQKDLLTNQVFYWGNQFSYPIQIHNPYSFKKLSKQLSRQKPYRCSKYLYCNAPIESKYLFLGLTMLGSEKSILFEICKQPVQTELVRLNPKQIICRIFIPNNTPYTVQTIIQQYFKRHLIELYDVL